MENLPNDLYRASASNQILNDETPPKAVIIFGARQVGKSTLLDELAGQSQSVRRFNGDDTADHALLRFNSATDFELTLRQADTIIIDEAQRFPNIGLILKQLVDVNVHLNLGRRIYAAASSSLELAQGVSESAVRRLIRRQMLGRSLPEHREADDLRHPSRGPC